MKSNSLSEIQMAIQEAVREKSLPAGLLEVIVEKPPISISERLKIYQNAYFLRLFESLKEDFTSVESLLGERRFERLATDFIARHPSKSRDLAEYSRDFPEFLRAAQPEAFPAAIRDWLQILTETSPEPEDALTLQQIQAGTPFLVQMHPAVHSQQLGARFLTSYRALDEVHFLEIEEKDFKLLKLLASPQSLDQFAAFAGQNEISEADLAALISNWLKLSIIYCAEVKS